VYGEIDKEFEAGCSKLGLALQAFAWSESAKHAGLRQDALYLVRPDGYVALASVEQSVSKLRGFVERFQLRFKEPAAQTRLKNESTGEET